MFFSVVVEFKTPTSNVSPAYHIVYNIYLLFIYLLKYLYWVGQLQ